jgi:hypothetical protein
MSSFLSWRAWMNRRLARAAALAVAVGLWTIETASGGGPFTLKVNSPKELGEGAVAFPDRDDLGTGTFRFDMAPGALAPGRKEAVVLHPFLVDGTPQTFEMTVAVPLSNRFVTVELSQLPPTERMYRGRFTLPQNLDPMRRHVIVVTFSKWKVANVTLDGSGLAPVR